MKGNDVKREGREGWNEAEGVLFFLYVVDKAPCHEVV
jgi:hypothetical protein